MSTEPTPESAPLPEIDLGDGRTVISYEGGAFYRVREFSGEVRALPAKTLATPENALDDIVTNPPAPALLPAPVEVTPLQMRRALNTAGLRSAVEAAVGAAAQDVRDAWEFASVIRRDDSLLAGVAAYLGKTSVEIDDLFRLASTF